MMELRMLDFGLFDASPRAPSSRQYNNHGLDLLQEDVGGVEVSRRLMGGLEAGVVWDGTAETFCAKCEKAAAQEVVPPLLDPVSLIVCSVRFQWITPQQSLLRGIHPVQNNSEDVFVGIFKDHSLGLTLFEMPMIECYVKESRGPTNDVSVKDKLLLSWADYEGQEPL
ncbi:hypothetical protein BKA80DRAFT_303197 [Phyllosticta citrichinensis]